MQNGCAPPIILRMSRSFKLFRLQQVNSQLDAAHTRLSEIEAILGDDELLQQAKAMEKKAEESKAGAERKLHSAEEEVKAQQIKIEHNQAALYGGSVSNPKELQDLQAEAAALNRHLQDLEDVQLEKMLTSEEAQSELQERLSELNEIEAQRTLEHGDLGIEGDKLGEEVERLSNERDATASGVSAEDLASYEKLRISKAGLAVAKVKDKTCSACGTILTQSLAQAARSPTELSKCSTCKRILYAG